MTYSDLQQRIYKNKVSRSFNVTDVGKELILMMEEFGELNDAYLLREEVINRDTHKEFTAKIVDAVGDLQVYNLGLSSMFGWKADEVINHRLERPKLQFASYPCRSDNSMDCGSWDQDEYKVEIHPKIDSYFPFAGRELGRLANAYKKSNKEPVGEIDRRDEFRTTIGNLMGYCSKMFEVLEADEFSVLEAIVKNNETRTHEGQI